MDYYSHYKFLLNYYNKDISLLITHYIYAKCIDCNDSWHEEFFECECNKLRCKQHTHFYTVLNNGKFKCNTCFDGNYNYNNIVKLKRVFIKCMYCDLPAQFGFTDIICYCVKHLVFRKSVIFTHCFDEKCINKGTFQSTGYSKCIDHQIDNKKQNFDSTTSKKPKVQELRPGRSCKITIWKYNDKRMSILNINGAKCSFCNMRYINMNNTCECKSYCDYCFHICVWMEEDKYVCNNCHYINNVNEMDVLDIYLKCHNDECFKTAKYGKYGILLYCKTHAKYDKLGYKCPIYDCYKLVVYKDRCYDHISEKIRKKIDYIIKN